MNRRAFARALAASCGSLGLGLLAALPAHAGSLPQAERDTLASGGVVRRPVDSENNDGTYLGGVSYGIVEAPAEIVLGLLRNVALYTRILSLTLEARAVGTKGDDPLIYFKHGGDLGTAGYTMRVHHAPAERTVRFWMDHAFEHEIDDVWGYFRIDPLGPQRCLATYAVLCDLGTVIRLVFGERIRGYALDTPANLQAIARDRQTVPGGLPLP